MEIKYKPSKTLLEFHKDTDHRTAFVRGIRGPIGSGKSVGMCLEVMLRARQQRPYKGVRRSRWVIIRNTYRELVDTTVKTWLDWFPERLGVWSHGNFTHTITVTLPDNTVLYLEVLFRALDRPNDVKKLLSLELTGGWINEAREMPKAVVNMLQGRVGRYPPPFKGGPSWYGVIMDTNSPDTDHWWYKVFDENLPENWSSYVQPSGMCDEAENLENLPEGYYDNLATGNDQEWINVYIHGKYGFIMEGRPIWPEYKDDLHSTTNPLAVSKERIFVGLDFGLTPAAAIGQITQSGQFQVIDEVVSEDMGAKAFGVFLKEFLHREYRDLEVVLYGDPAGEQRAQTDEMTPYMILHNVGLEVYPTYTNDFAIRREVVADYMMRLDSSGDPAFMVGPKAKMVRKALAGGYKYRRLQVSGAERFSDAPDKGRYSHVGDAVQYLMLGAVGGNRVIGGYERQRVDYANANLGIV